MTNELLPEEVQWVQRFITEAREMKQTWFLNLLERDLPPVPGKDDAYWIRFVRYITECILVGEDITPPTQHAQFLLVYAAYFVYRKMIWKPITKSQTKRGRKKKKDDGLSDEQRGELARALVWKKGPCPWPGCDSVITNPTNHRKTHLQERPHHCTIDGCTSSFAYQWILKKHIQCHYNDRPLQCMFPGCTKRFIYATDRLTHYRFHIKDKRYPCNHTGCHASFVTSGGLTDHLRVHTKERPFLCYFCDSAFTTYGNRNRHVQTHSGIRPYCCRILGCNAAFKDSGARAKHEITHSDTKAHTCTYGDCRQAFHRKDDLTTHIRIHTGEKPFLCPDEYCCEAFAQRSNRDRHVRCNHTLEGQARQKRKENRMHLELKKRDLKFDYGGQGNNPNYRLDLKCLDSNYTWIELDFLVQHPQVLMIPECQENGHKHYPISCEVKRWTNIYAVHTKNESENKSDRMCALYLVNPDSFEIDGVKQSVKHSVRMDVTADYLKNPERLPTRPFTIYFFGYNERDGRLLIWNDPDFPEWLIECCVIVHFCEPQKVAKPTRKRKHEDSE